MILCLVDGCSIRATVRITGVAKNTIQKLAKDVGQACLEFQVNVRPMEIKAGIANLKWSIEDMVGLLQVDPPKKRGQYKKKISN